MTTGQRRELGGKAITIHGLSDRQACRLLNISRAGYRYQHRRPNDGVLIARLQSLAERQPCWGEGRPMVDLGLPTYGSPE